MIKFGFKIGDKIIWQTETKQYFGTVKEVYNDHLIVNVPDVSDHCWFDKNNIDTLSKVKTYRLH